MSYRTCLSFLSLSLLLTAACGGEAFTSNGGDGDGDSSAPGDGDGDGDGDGPNPGDGDGDGDGDGPIINNGIEGRCMSDDDCLAVGVTNGACYSPGCDLPTAASKEDVANNSCLAPYNGLMAPPTPPECTFDSGGGDVACPAGCAAPPTCIFAYCDAGKCAVNTSQDDSDCTGSGGGGTGGGGTATCDELDRERRTALQSARSCVPDGIIAECTAGETIADDCGCPVVVNDNNPTAVEEAEAAYQAWNAQCEPPMICELIDCAGPSNSTSCAAAEDGGICVAD